jgi:hypothetical protein
VPEVHVLVRRLLVTLLLAVGLAVGHTVAPVEAAPDAPTHYVSLTQQRNICVFIDDNGPYWVLNRYRHLHYGVADVVQCEYIDYLFRPAYVCSQYVWNSPYPPYAWVTDYTVGTLDPCW